MSTPGPGAVQAKYAVRTRAGPLCGINRRVRGRRWWWLRTRRIAIAKGWGEVMSMRYVIPNGALLSADVFVTPGPAGHDRAKCKSSPTRHPTAAHGSLSSPCHSAHFLCSHAHRPLLRRPLQGESSAPPAQICHSCCERWTRNGGSRPILSIDNSSDASRGASRQHWGIPINLVTPQSNVTLRVCDRIPGQLRRTCPWQAPSRTHPPLRPTTSSAVHGSVV